VIRLESYNQQSNQYQQNK